MAPYGLVEALGWKNKEGKHHCHQWQSRVTEMARAEEWVACSDVVQIFKLDQNNSIYILFTLPREV
jgi:hypothetical protein